jgi:hypothetical protein
MVEVERWWCVRVPWRVVCVLICISCPPSLASRRASKARCMFLSSVQSSRVESYRARGIYALAACVGPLVLSQSLWARGVMLSRALSYSCASSSRYVLSSSSSSSPAPAAIPRSFPLSLLRSFPLSLSPSFAPSLFPPFVLSVPRSLRPWLLPSSCLFLRRSFLVYFPLATSSYIAHYSIQSLRRVLRVSCRRRQNKKLHYQ